MYIKRIEIKDLGPIVKMDFNFKFNSDKSPVPLIIIGENGKGKTLLLTSIVNGLIEYKKLKDEQDINQIYMTPNPEYINKKERPSGIDYLYVNFECSNFTNKFLFYNIVSRTKEGLLSILENMSEKILNLNEVNENYINVIKENDNSINLLDDSVVLYFPSSRVYTPSILNISMTNNKIDNVISDDIIVSDVLMYVLDWIRIVFEDKIGNQLLGGDEEFYDKNYANIQKYILNILSIVITDKNPYYNKELDPDYKEESNSDDKSSNLYFSKKTDKDIIFSYTTLSNGTVNSQQYENEIALSQLSSGQINLFSMFCSILKKYYDLNGNDINKKFLLEDIKGVVIIDEADLGLHANYARKVFPRLMNMFKNIQFIISTHSLFLIDGLKQNNDNIDLLKLPEGISINETLEEFSEIKEYSEILLDNINIFTYTKNDILKILSSTNLNIKFVILICEGESDKIMIKTTIDHYKNDKKINELFGNNEIFHVYHAGGSGNMKSMRNLKKSINNDIKIKIEPLIILMYDSDEKKGGKKDELFYELDKDLYEFYIPNAKHRNEDEISIEYYFTDDDIKNIEINGKRFFLKNEFNENDYDEQSRLPDIKYKKLSKDEKYVILSKKDKLPTVLSSKRDNAINGDNNIYVINIDDYIRIRNNYNTNKDNDKYFQFKKELVSVNKCIDKKTFYENIDSYKDKISENTFDNFKQLLDIINEIYEYSENKCKNKVHK